MRGCSCRAGNELLGKGGGIPEAGSGAECFMASVFECCGGAEKGRALVHILHA